MPDMNDFYAFKSTSNKGSNTKSDCGKNLFVWLAVAALFVWIVGRL